MSRMVVLADFWNAYDAALAVSALDAAGIPAICPDWHLFNLYPHLMMAATGPRLFVLEEDVDAAAAILVTGQAAAEPVFPCPKCGNRTYRMRRWILVILVTWLVLQLGLYATYGPLAFYKRKRFCWVCYHQHMPAPVEAFTPDEVNYDGQPRRFRDRVHDALAQTANLREQ